MNAYPQSAMSAAKLGKATAFLIAEAAKPGVTPRFSRRLERAGTDLEALLSGIGSRGQVKGDLEVLARSCDRYGVRASL
jgi:hypothetical protein